jgi:hypothetical protein
MDNDHMIPPNGMARNFKMKRVPRPSPYVEFSLRQQYARETRAYLRAATDIQIMNLEMAYGGPNFDGAGEEENA